MKRTTVIIILVLLGLNPLMYAQELEEYLQIAAENNPELQAYFNEYLAALERVPQFGILPDPELNVGFFFQPMERFMGKQQADIQLMQMFPWFGMLRTQKDEASKMALAQYQGFEDAKNRLFYEVKNTWYDMYRLEQEISITEANLEILQTYERLALIRFQSAGGISSSSGSIQAGGSMNSSSTTSSGSSMGSMGGGMNQGNTAKASSSKSTSQSMGPSGASMGSGNSGMSDVLQIRMEINELKNTLSSLKDSRVPLQAEFNQLLNREYNEQVALPDTLSDKALTMERLALLDSITQNNPMLKMLDAETEVYEVQKKMARLEGKPMLGAGVNYMPFIPRSEDGMSMGGRDMIMPMVSVSIPIYRKQYAAKLKEAELKQQAVQQRKESTVNQLSVQWATALRDLDDANRRTALYREQSGLAQQTLNLLMTSYSSSGQGFEEVLKVQQQLLDYQLKQITSIVDQHTTVAMLEMLAATTLN
ncbi:TolC family protein [Catalinimonas niigatensis]|uniref:TolC family protein n=1 Tax=Catalinimonas niigatensis TaxID=1397264 RepID=UPI002666665C|nr:TolC family protein [Catalinimonas niigatensis]WPP51873.1 TolC family protein [Catalinimonas niigatensis]